MEVTVNRRMIEICKRSIQLAQLSTEIAKQFRRLRVHLGERYSADEVDHPYQVVLNRNNLFAGGS